MQTLVSLRRAKVSSQQHFLLRSTLEPSMVLGLDPSQTMLCRYHRYSSMALVQNNENVGPTSLGPGRPQYIKSVTLQHKPNVT